MFIHPKDTKLLCSSRSWCGNWRPALDWMVSVRGRSAWYIAGALLTYFDVALHPVLMAELTRHDG